MATKQDAAWLAQNLGQSADALFTDADLELLSRVVGRRDFSRGDVLCHQGSRPPGVWILQEGWVVLSSSSGRRRLALAIFGERQCVGDVPLLLDAAAPYTARAVTDGAALFVARDDFRRLLSRNLRVSMRWTSKLAGVVARMQGRVVELLGESLEQQVARVLLHEGEQGEFPFSQEMCAALLGAARPSVNQVLRRFESEGSVRLSYGRIEILDLKHIVRIAS